MARPIEGDIVRMTRAWLRSTQAHGMADAVGEVTEVKGLSPEVVQVRWYGEGTTWSVLAKNIEVLDRPGPSTCACGDEEWGACGKDTCHDQYDYERNAV